MHSLTGRRTTSCFCRRGKNKFVKTFEKSEDLQKAAKVFNNLNKNIENIKESGHICILALYGAPKNIKCLNTLRQNFFIKGTPKKYCVRLASLPATNTVNEFIYKFNYGLKMQFHQMNEVGILDLIFLTNYNDSVTSP